MSVSREELHSLAIRDPLAFGITYLDLLDGKEWEVGTRPWATDIYKAVNPWEIEKYPVGQAKRLAVTKSTQAGISTMGIVRMFHFVTNWDGRVMYTLPRQQDVLDMVTTRIDPMINGSPYLKSKLRTPDSTHAKGIAGSFIYFTEMSVEPRMVPVDLLFVDEVDLSNPDYMGTAVNRMDASRWKLSYYLSTPTVPNYGIHAIYSTSDKRRWLVKCPQCNHEQPLDWEKNLRVVGAQINPTRVFYGCEKCDTELTLEHIQTGRWVAEVPELSNETIGFHVHQMLTTRADTLYKIYRDPQTTLIEFYRKRLGMPYEVGGGHVTRDDFLVTCFDEPYDFEPSYDGRSTYYLGCDQGNELQVIVSKIEPGSRRPKIVHIELIPQEQGFDRLAQIINLYKVRRGIVDANPNRHASIALTHQFPGRILIADYVEQRDVWKATKRKNASYLTNVAMNRTASFDGLMDSIKKGMWALPGNPPKLPPDVELLIDHTTALKKDIETRRTASGETQVAVYRKLRAEHLAHAWSYMKIAKDIDRGRGSRISIASSEEVSEKEIDPNRPPDKAIIDITYHLAEVPKEQLSEYLVKKNYSDYKIPFPLSFKLKKVEETNWSEDFVEWVMGYLVEN